MATSTLSETDSGTYIDRTGDIVLVFTDTDKKKKSIILQRDMEQVFGRFAHLDDGYYEGDYSPYLPVRLFLPNTKRPDQLTYGFKEIERNEDYDGAWIGDQGTLIIHRSESRPSRMLHVMFSYDANYELRPILYHFSPILSPERTTEKFIPIMNDELLTIAPVEPDETNIPDSMRETFRDKLDDIQKQIDEMKEQVSNALSIAQTAEATTNIIASSISTLEEENKHQSNARDIPDSEGFWRDSDGDVWVRDAAGSTLLISKGHKEGGHEIYELPRCPEGMIQECGPYIKIDNPFIQGENHAD